MICIAAMEDVPIMPPHSGQCACQGTDGRISASGSTAIGPDGERRGAAVGRGKPVGAVVAAATVLRALHASERPLNASEVARAAGLHRGTAYNILRTLHAEALSGMTRRRAATR